MPIPQLLNDIILLLLALAPAAALVSLVLAGINLRREGGVSFAIGGGFTRWTFWAVVFMTLSQLVSWFNTIGVNTTLPGGSIGTSWLAGLQSDITAFLTSFLLGRLVPTLAAFFVLRSILDAASGGHPLPSIVAAMFLLGTQTTLSMLQGFNTGTPFATADVLDSLWNHLAGTVMPIAAVLALVGGILNFATRKPFVRNVAVALALLCVSAIWKLVLAMM